jgi:formylglycine-generating enzyme required for sulfatase activity
MDTNLDTEQLERRLVEIDTAIEQWPSDRPAPDSLRRERYEVSRALSAVSRADTQDAGQEKQGHVFAIMPFSSPFDAYYEGVIKPAVQDAGFRALRSDEIFSPQAFIQTIWEQILGADVVIAEMTGANANVLYELGLCHAINRRVVMITQKIEDVPSDLRHINLISYDTTELNWEANLRNAIQNMILFTNGSRLKAVLDPPASTEDVDLFDGLHDEAKRLRSEIRVHESAAARQQRKIDAIRAERNSYKAILASDPQPSGDGRALRIHKDGELTLASLPLPESEEVLELVQVPAGPFISGLGPQPEKIELGDFWITRYSITNAQFCVFLNRFGNRHEGGVPWVDLDGSSPVDECRVQESGGKFTVPEAFADHPVTYVNYFGATAFCAWLGGELPTVEMWEKAVRGVDGREYPWGNQPPEPRLANIESDGWDRDVAPIPVAEKVEGASPFGVVQGIGNVWHWTSTFFPDRGVQAVRGGSFFDYRLGQRQVYRFQVHPDGPDFSQGFLLSRRLLTSQEHSKDRDRASNNPTRKEEDADAA